MYCNYCGFPCWDWICENCWKEGKHIKMKKINRFVKISDEDYETIDQEKHQEYIKENE